MRKTICHCALLFLIPFSTSSLFAQGKIHQFQTVQLDTGFYAEGASAADLDRDGYVDAIAGPFWWRGPGFVKRELLYPARSYDPAGYSEAFFSFPYDMDGDGW
jgi:hypothetical protein